MDVIPSGFSFRFKNGEAIPGGDNAGRHYNELSRPE
jgi:hypothetical protein